MPKTPSCDDLGHAPKCGGVLHGTTCAVIQPELRSFLGADASEGTA